MAQDRARTLIADGPGPCCTRKGSVLVTVVLLVSLAGCAGAAHIALAGATLIDNVPYLAQEDFQCGPAALATVINYWHLKEHSGTGVTVESVVAAIFSPSARGVLGLDLELYARRLGFLAIESPGTVQGIRKHIDAGFPVIVLVDYGRFSYQQNHFMVAKGYTDRGIIFNSGPQENLVVPNGDLEKIWKRTGFWSLVIRPSS